MTTETTQVPEGFSPSCPVLTPVPVSGLGRNRGSIFAHRRNRHKDAHQILQFFSSKRSVFWSSHGGTIGEHIAVEEAGEGEGKKAVGKPSLLAKWLNSLEMPRDVVPLERK